MKENIVHSTNPLESTSFPFLTLEIKNENCFPSNLGFRKIHWHEELQFIYVLEGVIKIKTINESIELKKGEAIFINKGVLHETTEKSDCHYRSFIFHEKFLTFYSGSFMEKNNVLPITNNFAIHSIVFKPTKQWKMEVLKILEELNKLEKNKLNEENYEYKVSMKLINIWFFIISNIDIEEVKSSATNNVKYNRVRKFLSYISLNYENDISLKDIAESDNVSEAECIRCFKSIIYTTPYKYLLEYRLNKSIDLLKNTDYSITEIGAMVGFNHSSHYIKYFKEHLNMTPLEFRNINKKSI